MLLEHAASEVAGNKTGKLKVVIVIRIASDLFSFDSMVELIPFV